MEEDRQLKGGDTDAPETSITTHNIHEQPAVASLIDVDTDVDAITAEPLTPTNKPLHIDLAEKLQVGGTTVVAQTQPPKTSPDISVDSSSLRELLPTIDERETLQSDDETRSSKIQEGQQPQCDKLQSELIKVNAEKSSLEQEIIDLKARLQMNKEELVREVQKRVELENRFTDEAKRTSDQIEELLAKSESDDNKLNELRNRFELYSREASSMIESFTTNRELLASQLLELRRENDFFLGKYLKKSRALQSADIDLPQTVEELQFHCLNLTENIILSTMAKERLEEAMIMGSTAAATPGTNVSNTPTTS